MKFKDLITNLMGNSIFMAILFYLFVDWFYSMSIIGTSGAHYSHFIDVILYPIIGLLWLMMSRGEPFTKFTIWTNRIAFVGFIAFAVIFYINISDGEYMLSKKDVCDITENNTKYFVQVDSLTYYIDKNDTINYDITNWKIYQFVREDMFNDTIFGGYCLSDGEKFLGMRYIDNR